MASNNLCHLCTKNTNSSVCLNQIDTDDVKYIDKLKFICSDVLLEEDSKTSFQICRPCCKKLKQAYDFKKQCVTSFEYWKFHFHPSNPNIKKEINSFGAANIKTEENALPTRKRGRPKKVPTENQIMVTSLKNKLGSVLKTKNTEPNPSITNLKNKLSTLLKPESEIKKEICDDVANPIQLNFTNLKSKLGNALRIGIQNFEEEKVTPVSKPLTKKHTKQKYFVINKSFYIIDIRHGRFYCKSCNKYFLNLKSLKVHIIQDLGIKNVLCKLCKKRFFSRRELKLHIHKHK